MDLKKFQDLLGELSLLPKVPTKEANIFNIGSRGYYENPTTDILAFFCDTNGNHGLGSLVLESIIDCLAENTFDIHDDFELVKTPEREVRTSQDKRIDLLLTGTNWVIILENKIYHQQNNPFSEYERYAKSKFKDKEKIIFILLSPSGQTEQSCWHGISYQNLLISIKAKLGDFFIDKPFNKWVLFLKEFILHLESFMSKTSLPDESINFVFDNIADIVALEQLKNTVINEYQRKIQIALSNHFDCEVCIRLHNWSGKPAMRFYLDRWKSDSDVVLHNKDDSGTKFSINFYFRAKIPGQFDEVDKLIPDISQLSHWEEQKGRYRGFQRHLSEMTFDEIVETIAERLKQIDEYEKTRD